MDKYQIICLIAVIFTAMPMLAGLICYRKLSNELKLLALLFLLIFMVEAYSFYLNFAMGSNQWLFHFYNPIEFTIFLSVFKAWHKDIRIKDTIKWLIPAFILLCLVNDLFWGSQVIFYLNGNFLLDRWVDYNFLPPEIAGILYAALAAFTLFRLFNDDKGDILHQPVFWISAGLLLYSSGTIMYFVFNELIRIEKIVMIWIIYNIINLIANQLYAIGFITYYRNRDKELPDDSHLSIL
jgi:hypothetical protein